MSAEDNNAVRNVYWTPWSAPGVEQLLMTDHGDRISAFSLILRPLGGQHLRIRIGYHADAQWNTRRVMVATADAEETDPRRVVLESDGQGHWQMMEQPAPQFDGCLDADVEITPFSNTVPIRRLGMAEGASVETKAVYVPVPSLTPRVVHQRYTCLEQLGPSGGTYRYENLDSGFSADLKVDADGLVMDYPETFRRSWPT